MVWGRHAGGNAAGFRYEIMGMSRTAQSDGEGWVDCYQKNIGSIFCAAAEMRLSFMAKTCCQFLAPGSNDQRKTVTHKPISMSLA